MAGYVVRAPYVTLKVSDANGAEVVQGFYEGALVENAVEGEELDRHVRKGLVEKGSAKDAFGAGAVVDAPVAPKPGDRRTK